MKLLSTTLKKAQMLEFLGLPKKSELTKEQLVTQLQLLIETRLDEYTRLLETYVYELAVGPTELQELWQCSSEERRRWVKEEKIPVLEYRAFRKAGQDLLYAVHDRRVILALQQEEIAKWREEHQVTVQGHRKAGASAAVERKKVNQSLRQNFLVSWQQMVAEWTCQGSPALSIVLQLCFWTAYASRWAKENHLKHLRGIKYSVTYAARRDAWYARKNEAMRVLVQTPYAHLTYYRPDIPDKRRLWLCEEHYAMKKEAYYETIWDFFYDYIGIIKQCPHCTFNEEKDYYALYHLEVKARELPEVSFSFHMPYPIGKRWFPAPGSLPHVSHVEQDGIFRFGRSLFANERVIHREKDVLAYLEEALAEVKKIYALDKQVGTVQDGNLC